jgi:hypothetical protein
MSRIYATDDNGRRLLYQIKCDGANCHESIVPNSQISSSGWLKRGTDTGIGSDKLEWYYCPRCSDFIG